MKRCQIQAIRGSFGWCACRGGRRARLGCYGFPRLPYIWEMVSFGEMLDDVGPLCVLRLALHGSSFRNPEAMCVYKSRQLRLMHHVLLKGYCSVYALPCTCKESKYVHINPMRAMPIGTHGTIPLHGPFRRRELSHGPSGPDKLGWWRGCLLQQGL